MTKIPLVGFDPALRNFGVAKVLCDIDTLELEVVDLKLTTTELDKSKKVRKASDNLRRAQELHQAMIEGCAGQMFAFAEIPAGSESAQAAIGFGIAIGVLSATPIPLIEVSNYEAKLAAVGTRTASKQEMIEWASEKWPEAPWLRARGKATGAPTLANEHLADALAILTAGVRTKEFERTLTFIRSQRLLAA